MLFICIHEDCWALVTAAAALLIMYVPVTPNYPQVQYTYNNLIICPRTRDLPVL